MACTITGPALRFLSAALGRRERKEESITALKSAKFISSCLGSAMAQLMELRLPDPQVAESHPSHMETPTLAVSRPRRVKQTTRDDHFNCFNSFQLQSSVELNRTPGIPWYASFGVRIVYPNRDGLALNTPSHMLVVLHG